MHSSAWNPSMPPHYSYNKYQCLIKSHYSLASTCLSNNPPHILPLLLTTLQSLEFPDSLNVQCFLLLLSHFSRCFLSPKIPSVLSCPTLCLTTYSSDFRSQFNFLFLPKTFSENQVQVRYFCSSHPWCSLITSMVCLIKFNCNCFFFLISFLKTRTISAFVILYLWIRDTKYMLKKFDLFNELMDALIQAVTSSKKVFLCALAH